jgi:hypothetical protein
MHIGTAYLPYLSEFSILALPIRIQYTCLTYQNSVYLPYLSEFREGILKNKQTTKELYI